MDVTLAYPSSLDYWRYASLSEEGVPTSRCSLKSAGAPSVSHGEVVCLARMGIRHPIHLFCTDPKQRKRTGSAICHVTPVKNEEKEFFFVKPGLRTSSPELCLAQSALHASFPDLLMLCYEFCGTYTVDASSKAGFAPRCKPLTSVSMCQDFIDRHPSLRGTNALNHALSHVANRSASPNESKLSIILSLPCLYGGYALPLPQHHCKLVLADGSVIQPNLYWPDKKIGLVLSSKLANPQGAAKTSTRSIGCITVIAVGEDALQSKKETDAIVRRLARLMGFRMRPRGKFYPQHQEDLRRSLGLPCEDETLYS